MLKLSALVGKRYATSAASLALHWRSGVRAPLPNIFGSVPSTAPSKTMLQPVTGVNMVYYSTIAAAQSAWRTLVPSVTRQVVGKLTPRVPVNVRAQPRPLVSKYMNKRAYCAPQAQSWKDVPIGPRPGPITLLWRGFRSLTGFATLVLNATAVWYLHSSMHKDNPTWVSYLSFVPLLDWLPMLDIAGLPRYLILLPATVIGIASLVGLPSAPVLGLLFVLPIFGLEIYRNYHILNHFEQRNWTTLFFWTVFRMEWLVVSGLSILGFDRYQLVPHKQASITETMQQVRARLDESLEKPELLNDFNVPFIVFNFLWKYGLKTAVDATASFVHSTGIPDATGEFSDKAGAYIDSLIPSSSTTPSDSEQTQHGQKQEQK